MGFLDRWRDKRQARLMDRAREEREASDRREADARRAAILLAVTTRVANAALRETEKERSRGLTPLTQTRVVNEVGAKSKALMWAATDFFGGDQVARQFLPASAGGTSELGDFPLLCVYIAAAIKNCAALLETSERRHGVALELEGASLPVSHEELVEGIDTMLATCVARAEWAMSDQQDVLSDYLRRLLTTSVGQRGLQFAGPIATKALANLGGSSPRP